MNSSNATLPPTGVAPPRLRTVRSRHDLDAEPVGPAELRAAAVHVKAEAIGAHGTLAAVRTVLPWIDVWTEHESYRSGLWRCVVDESLSDPQFTAYRKRTLDFHTDMSRYLRPPEFTIIRCVRPDPVGGDNLILHIDDILDRLAADGQDDIVAMLSRPRRLIMEDRHYNDDRTPTGAAVTAALAVRGADDHPARIFDRHGATKGSHLELDAAEEYLLDAFLDRCAAATDLSRRVRLEQGDLLAFSNWRLMHARLACAGSGRITEIAMGNEAPRPQAVAHD